MASQPANEISRDDRVKPLLTQNSCETGKVWSFKTSSHVLRQSVQQGL